MSDPAIFLDRDGTIIRDCDYLSDPDAVAFLPGAAEALRRFQEMGFRLFILTNQSGIGRGYFTEDDMHAVHARLTERLTAEGIRVEKIYACPHAPDAAGCTCRKPATGMIEQATTEFDLDLSASYVVGDKQSDVELARAAGCVPVLVRTGYGRQNEENLAAGLKGTVVCDDLAGAVRYILSA